MYFLLLWMGSLVVDQLCHRDDALDSQLPCMLLCNAQARSDGQPKDLDRTEFCYL
jgi:hypothetical protein